ncbi:MAG: phosphodiester glycosidase family protein, partial [Chitinophagaceae bacterium]|nr:phosphodiester glycosidase family protein [Chitinophagaceae bacterium]
MKKIQLLLCFCPLLLNAQVKWINVDSLFQPLPPTVHVYFTNDSIDGAPNIAYYISAELKDKNLDFTVDTTLSRRLTPQQYFERNNQPLLVVNTTFFEFKYSKNLNTVIQNGKLIGYNIHSIAGKGKDTLTYRHSFGSAIGITKSRKADVAWLFTDSSISKPKAYQTVLDNYKDSFPFITAQRRNMMLSFKKWKMQTAVGGGPVLIQNGEIQITNNEELKFSGKSGLTDKHPRTCMGYTKDGLLIVMVIQGRMKGIAEGVNLVQEAQLLKDVGCWEALNLDGGGSSC